MLWLIVFLASGLVVVSVFNFFTLRTPNNVSEILESVSVLVPLRNESHNVEALIASLQGQLWLKNVEYILLDDNSQDNTFDLLTSAIVGLPDFYLLKGQPLPDGWIGKSWALNQLIEASHGEIIVSIDADVRIKPEAISKSITLLKSAGIDFLSPYPRQIALTLGERVIQPLLQWSWMCSLPLAIAERSSFSSMAVANGQFFIARRSAIELAGGYEIVKNQPLDDVFLARALVKTGAHGVVVNGADLAQCRMYKSWSEIESGYGKSLRHAFGSIFGALVAVVFLFLTGVAPIILIFLGSSWGWFSLIALILTRALSAIRSRTRIFDSLLHPLSSTLLIYLIFYSFIMRSEITWKGRTL